MTRSEAAKILCEKLVARIEKIAPPGIGADPRTWEAVGPADAEFALALIEWIRTGTDEHRAEVKVRYSDVLAAWANVAEGAER